MRKNFLQIGFVISTSIAAFLLGLHISDCKKDIEIKKNSTANVFYSQRQEHPPILIVYHKDKTKADKTKTPESQKIWHGSCMVGVATIDDPSIPLKQLNDDYKSTIDYLIKWDELEGWFTSENDCPRNEFSGVFWLAGITK
jgi:hypothetical protein